MPVSPIYFSVNIDKSVFCCYNCISTDNTVAEEGEILVSINFRDSRPIYEQIKDNLRKLIITGGISPGEKLPSVRDFSSQLAINPNTIQRAYRELENEGYVYTIPGKGSFAAQKQEVDQGRKAELLSNLDALISELKYLGVSESQLIARIKGVKDK